MQGNPFWDYWYFHVPNYALALAAYLVVGRLLLSFFVHPQSSNYIWRSFVRLTDPVVRAVAVITPRQAPLPVILVFSFLWLFVARIALYLALAAAGAPPGTG
jgi:uncharacterized protein YggT (Ycf19 family)